MKKILLGFITAALLVGVLIACTSPGTDTTAPTVSSTVPLDAAVGVAASATVNATFSQAMDETTIIGANFTLAIGTIPVSGTVTYDATSKTATFTPAAKMAGGTQYTATITTGVQDSAGIAMAARKVWTFNTATVAKAGPAPLNLGLSGNFAVLAETAITDTGSHITAISGDVGLYTGTHTAIGFLVLTPNASPYSAATYATSPQVTGSGTPPAIGSGTVYTADMGAGNTAVDLNTAVNAMTTAFTTAPNPPTVDHTNLLAGILSTGTSLAPGYYTWNTAVHITGNITIAGGGGTDDVWIFDMSGNLNVDSAVIVSLAGGAQAKNVFWRVGGAIGATLGTSSKFKGVILSAKQIIMQTGSSLTGRALSQTQVTLDETAVTQP